METQNTSRKIQWLPILLIVWNLFDIGLHIALDLVEPLRVAGNIAALTAAAVVLLGLARASAPHVLGLAALLVVGFNLWESILYGFLWPSLIFIGVSLFLLVRWAQVEWSKANSAKSDNAARPIYLRWWVAIPVTLVLVAITTLGGPTSASIVVQMTQDGALVGADYWSDEPRILSAGLGFEGIIGIAEYTEETVREAEGSWFGSMTCTSGEEPSDSDRTSATTPTTMAAVGEGTPDYADALPIVFSWPVATETIDITDFQYTLNNGEIGLLTGITMFPNWELNERNVVVLYGEFANRGLASEEDAIFPVRLDIVEDETPLLLIGPNGEEFNAVGLSWETDATPYDSGPRLVGAKINHVGDEAIGEGGIPALMTITGAFPNDEFAMYGGGDFRIRVLTTGGFSPDGVTALRPHMYEDFFRVHVNGEDGETVLLENVGEEYTVAGGTLRVLGLAETGQKENPDAGIYYDDCYDEDRDNYIDIILEGDEEAARNVTFVEIPSLEGGYRAFYNPGGPGPEPFEGVRYTAPGPPDMEPVIMALDDPMRVDRAAP
ncbi:MAG: phospholipase [Caldilineaceae bacterium]